MQLCCKPFGEDERCKGWQIFVKKLSADHGKYVRVNAEVKEYIYDKEVCAMKWNGRETRIGFQIAVASAEYVSKKIWRGHDTRDLRALATTVTLS
ncbi:hypothetical protein G7054_g3048 [Neopestalotiopsis clavispora]|nr:hypothetical protein G7054_g3048 [Neopestalotiopsis clavispora]